MKLVYMAGVRTGVHVFAICLKTGILFILRNSVSETRDFFMYQYRTFTAQVHPLI